MEFRRENLEISGQMSRGQTSEQGKGFGDERSDSFYCFGGNEKVHSTNGEHCESTAGTLEADFEDRVKHTSTSDANLENSQVVVEFLDQGNLVQPVQHPRDEVLKRILLTFWTNIGP